MTRFCLIGPTYPYRGGIAHYTTLLAQALRAGHEAQVSHDVLLLSFSRQYPRWLFPGRSDRDPSERPLRTEAEYCLDPLNPLSWWRTWRRIKAWQPEVVVIPWWVPFWAPAWSVLGRGIKRLRPAPKLLFICHNVLPHEKGLLDRVALRLALAAGDGYVVHAQADGRRLLAQFPQAKMAVTPLPTYAALGEKTAVLPVRLPDGVPIALFFGLVRPYKGVDVLLEAMALVERPLHLVIAGEFWQDEAGYRAQIERLGLATAVTILNKYVPDEEVAALMQRADVVVLPYRSATQSAIVQVAFGHGKPVITTDVGGLAEAVQHEVTGLIVPPEQPAALAAAMDRFFVEELGPVLGENVRGENGRFGWERLIQTLLKLAEL
ncbi:MAG: glycosyltransferase [Ardenticatenaceae bacterium]|nr:glycosyltransferase [Ardenticatenaceae bacterium]